MSSSAQGSSTSRVGLKCWKICKTYLLDRWSIAGTRTVVVVVVIVVVITGAGSSEDTGTRFLNTVARLNVTTSLGLLLVCSSSPSGLNSSATGLGA